MKLEQILGDKQQYKLFVDLDGVLASFDNGVKKLMPEFIDGDPSQKGKMWKKIKEYQKQGGEFWFDLELTNDAVVLWDFVDQFEGTEILTAYGDPSFGAADQKIRWVKKYLGDDVKVNLVRTSKEKANYANSNTILIDDRSKSIDPFVAAGGKGILHTSAADTIKKLQELLK